MVMVVTSEHTLYFRSCWKVRARCPQTDKKVELRDTQLIIVKKVNWIGVMSTCCWKRVSQLSLVLKVQNKSGMFLSLFNAYMELFIFEETKQFSVVSESSSGD